MKVVRKVLIGLGATIALVLVLLLVLPLLFRDRIVARVKHELNQTVNARIEWRDVGFSFLRRFPNLMLRVDDLSIVGVDRFANDTLAHVGRFAGVIDVRSVVSSLLSDRQMVIRSIELDRPRVHLAVLEDGSASWHITKTKAADSVRAEPSNFNIGLRRLQLRDARVAFDNAAANVHAVVSGLQHTLSGDFTRDRFGLRTETHADSTTLTFAGMKYLSDVAIDIRANLDADMANRKFTFQDNEVRVNELRLAFSGSAAQSGEELVLDLSASAPSTEFKHILSLVPALYLHDFAALQASGAVSLDARVNGRYGKTAFPSFSVAARVSDGEFRYPDLPLPVQRVAVELAIDNPGHHVDSTVVHVKRFHAELANRPVNATLLVRTPVSDPNIDFSLDGELDLGDVNRALKLPNIEQLNGAVTADLAVRGRLSHMSGGRYDSIAARGQASARNLALKTSTLPHLVAVEEAQLQLSPQHVALNTFKAKIGSSDVQLTGQIDNLIGFLLRAEDLRGRASVRSASFNLDEWRSREQQRQIIAVPPRLDFTLAADVAQLHFNKLDFTNARGRLRVHNQRVTLEDFGLNAFGGELGITGFYETKDVARPTFDAKLALKELNIPNAAAGLLTIRTLAPVASFVQGTFSADINLAGALGGDLVPLFEVLNGQGSVLTSALALRDFPLLDRIADGLKFQQLRDPTFAGIRSSIEIRDGRLHVRPFELKLGDTRMTVAGSNGIDQSLQYGITLAIPRTALGAEATRAISNVAAQTARAGFNMDAPVIELGVDVTGTVRDPTIKLDASRRVAAAGTELGRAIGQELEQRAEARVDSAKLEAQRRARVIADSVLRDAEARAAQIREEARKLADNVRAEGNRQADALLARATTPIARAAAQPAADRLRREANTKADQIVREADQRAEQILAEARRRGGGN